MDYKDLTIIIPTLNEQHNIMLLITELRLRYKQAKILVVDDGSTDATQALVKSAHTLYPEVSLLDRSLCSTKGLTASVLDGIMFADTKYFIVMDGDLQHPPETIESMYALLKNNQLVMAERNKVLIKWSLHRKLMSWLATLLGNLRLAGKGFGWRDVMTGYFGAHTDYIMLLIANHQSAFYAEGYKVLFDLLKLLPRGTKIGTVKYMFGLRNGGTSKIGWRHIKIYMKSLVR